MLGDPRSGSKAWEALDSAEDPDERKRQCYLSFQLLLWVSCLLVSLSVLECRVNIPSPFGMAEKRRTTRVPGLSGCYRGRHHGQLEEILAQVGNLSKLSGAV
jgi:hypothetical protein